MSCAVRTATWVCDLCREVMSVTLDYCTGCGARRYPASATLFGIPIKEVPGMTGLPLVVPAGVETRLHRFRDNVCLILCPPDRKPGIVDVNAPDAQAQIDKVCGL